MVKLENAVQTEIDDDVTDSDGDGFDAIEYGGNDCDDDNVAINPEAEERLGMMGLIPIVMN